MKPDKPPPTLSSDITFNAGLFEASRPTSALILFLSRDRKNQKECRNDVGCRIDHHDPRDRNSLQQETGHAWPDNFTAGQRNRQSAIGSQPLPRVEQFRNQRSQGCVKDQIEEAGKTNDTAQ